jgi:hypothetical protein
MNDQPMGIYQGSIGPQVISVVMGDNHKINGHYAEDGLKLIGDNSGLIGLPGVDQHRFARRGFNQIGISLSDIDYMDL